MLLYIFIYIIFELYEVQWQKASTMEGMLVKMYSYYKRSIFVFLLMHPTFYFAITFMLYTHYNIYALLLLTIKSADIATKLVLMKQVFIDKKISDEVAVVLTTPIHPLLPYIGLTLYPFFIYMSFT